MIASFSSPATSFQSHLSILSHIILDYPIYCSEWVGIIVVGFTFRGFSARKQCDIDTQERYGHGMCNHDTKKGAKPMIVAMGYDEANQRYQMVSNAESRQNKPERILKQCQKQGYADCQVVFDGNIRQ